ncbi:tetratricopeptide repeat protein [Actinoplanes sp. KI2]|uniref:BTAD domain-containing putative transcriptional regulator n=1 Tax=Actinoplanes sp. KI2 TaxID=2983315 RepID=UPI0021D58C94|nr:BTAD domain-containing putative transcriptional regulator [Actinoplanes sp. KI2]MCU7730042.1 tetratricopeptide repeat protein [Actinoplanes sp. KI2]
MDETLGQGGFGALLRTSRRAAGLSQQRLADRVGISLAAIRDLEQGRTRRPQRDSVDAIVAALRLAGETETTLRRAAEQSGTVHPVQIRVLGPLRVSRGGADVAVGRSMRRAVLGRLALSANTPVSPSDLTDLLWGGRIPPDPKHALQTYLSRLRTALQSGPDDIISRTSGGYRLNLADGQLDLADFRRRIGEARAAEPVRALDLLDDALALWDGSPLSDVPQLRDHPLVTAVLEERIAATLRYADLALASGHAGRCLPRLRELASASPLHEPVHARLIAALAAGSLQASALQAYAEIRRRLVEELGIEPGPELVEVHRRVLRQESSSPGPAADDPPAQLPADIARFTGRRAALARLDGMLDADRHPPAIVITAVSGTAGVGKTALAVHWAHRVRHRFPDGQLYVNLRGYDDGGQTMDPGEALRGFLHALGVAAERIPEGVQAQAGLYRSVLAGRRMLVVLDNARDAEQVRPLLPGGAGVVVVTSRSQLTGLIAVDGARPLTLDVLSAGEARELLTARLGAAAADTDRAAVARIVGACARLPLALTLAAARVQVTGFPLAAVAAELADASRLLDVLDAGDRMGQIRAVFSCSYAALSPAAARMFLLLGLHPGPEISAAAAASLAARTAPEALALLAELTRASLLSEPYPGRFAIHDLLRAYAHEQARARLADGDRNETVRRLLAHYLHTAHAADRQINPYRDPLVLPDPPPGVVTEQHADPAAALAWFGREHAGLLAAIRYAAADDRPTACWQLAWAIATYLDRRGHWQDWTVVARLAVDAAGAHGDRLGRAHASAGLGRAHGWLGRHEDAIAELERALAAFTEIGDRVGQATVHGHLAWLLDRWDRHQEAYDHIGQALHCYEEAGVRPGVADALARLGYHEAKVGRPRAALDKSLHGLALHRLLGNQRGEAITLAIVANIYQYLDQVENAVSYYERSADLLHRAGERYYEGRCLAALGDTYRASGRLTEARTAWQRALDILTDLRHPEADVVRAKLRHSRHSIHL